MKTIEVVAAIIIKEGEVFATQRGYGEFKGWWEFPGGKIESEDDDGSRDGEDAQQRPAEGAQRALFAEQVKLGNDGNGGDGQESPNRSIAQPEQPLYVRHVLLLFLVESGVLSAAHGEDVLEHRRVAVQVVVNHLRDGFVFLLRKKADLRRGEMLHQGEHQPGIGDVSHDQCQRTQGQQYGSQDG